MLLLIWRHNVKEVGMLVYLLEAVKPACCFLVHSNEIKLKYIKIILL